MAGGAETPDIAALPAIVLIGAGSGRRSAREAIDLSNDGGVTLGRLFTNITLMFDPNTARGRASRAWGYRSRPCRRPKCAVRCGRQFSGRFKLNAAGKLSFRTHRYMQELCKRA